MQYALTQGTAVIRINDDGTSDSFGPENREWAGYLAWRQAGNTPTPYVAPVEIPDGATASQVIVWLGQNSNANGNYLSQVVAYCNSLPLGHPVRTAWEKEPYFKRSSPTFQGIAQLLGLSSQQIDDGLVEANQIEF